MLYLISGSYVSYTCIPPYTYMNTYDVRGKQTIWKEEKKKRDQRGQGTVLGVNVGGKDMMNKDVTRSVVCTKDIH